MHMLCLGDCPKTSRPLTYNHREPCWVQHGFNTQHDLLQYNPLLKKHVNAMMVCI